MILIQLEATANQELKFIHNGLDWRIELKQALQSMTVSVWLDNEPLISCQRIIEGTPFFVYPHLMTNGNFGIVSDGPIDWREFGASQNLYYWGVDE